MAPAFPEIPTDRAGFLLSRVGTAVQSGFKDLLAGWDIRPLHFLVLERSGVAAQVRPNRTCAVCSVSTAGTWSSCWTCLRPRGTRTGRPMPTTAVDMWCRSPRAGEQLSLRSPEPSTNMTASSWPRSTPTSVVNWWRSLPSSMRRQQKLDPEVGVLPPRRIRDSRESARLAEGSTELVPLCRGRDEFRPHRRYVLTSSPE